MKRLYENYNENLVEISSRLAVKDNFDVIERRLTVGKGEVCLFYIDGFVKDGEMQRVMQQLLSEKSLLSAEQTLKRLAYVEVEITSDVDAIIRAVLSGQSALFGESFSDKAILIDARTYPARPTGEPDSDRVISGSHDGFVETLVMNTALIRRRIRDTRLTMTHFSVGSSSKTDVVMCYMKGVADESLVDKIASRLEEIRPKALTLGFQSLAESLIRRGWFNPFPKIRTTERPDTAASQLLEGSVLVLCDTSPQVMILPTSLFQYLEQADDYYFPPLTGTYLRLVRTVILLLCMIATPLWYLYLQYADRLPDALRFLIPDSPGALPIILQLLLVEAAIDGLKIASMNTPDMLSNSLSVVGALILGDFAVEVGWLSADVILYMAFVAIATFAQQNNELGYALKFVRVITLLLVYFFRIWGFAAGIILFVLLIATNNTVTGRQYLYPLFPFKKEALKSLIIRRKKRDFTEE
jgi:stage V sporulation protein AF